MESDFLDHLVKFNALAGGRDKLFRLAQYVSKFTWYYMNKADLNPVIVVKLKRLSDSLSTTRKFMRLGKSIDFLHGALRSIHLSDNVLRWSITLSKLNQSLFLLFDHVIWAGRVGLAVINKDKWSKLSAKFWMITIILNLIRDMYEIILIYLHEQKIRNAKASRSQYRNGVSGHLQMVRPPESNRELMSKTVFENKPLFLDLVRNLCDLLLPLDGLGYLKSSPGVQGLTGTVSSLISIASTWDPLLRLVPS